MTSALLFIMENKTCTKCKQEFPNNEQYFHLDKAKVKLGHYIVLAAACKICKNKLKTPSNNIYRKKIAEVHGTVYQYRKKVDPFLNEKINLRQKKYIEMSKDRQKKYRAEKTESYLKRLEKDKIKHRNEVAEMTDYYISKLIAGKDGTFTYKDFINNKELIQAYRLNLTLKRELKND